MANRVRKTEHAGAKKGQGAYWGPKRVAKSGSNIRRRRQDKGAAAEGAATEAEARADESGASDPDGGRS